jgi:hypothetical protein
MTQGKSFDQYGRDFHAWLLWQHERADPVGDLAAALRRNKVPPPQDYDKFRTYILQQPGGRQAYSEWSDYAWQADRAQ